MRSEFFPFFVLIAGVATSPLDTASRTCDDTDANVMLQARSLVRERLLERREGEDEDEAVVIEHSYKWGAMHTNSCPGGSAVSEADCLAAVQGLLGSGQSQGRSHLVAGSWGHVPTGCSAQTHFTHGRNGDFAAHYNRNEAQAAADVDEDQCLGTYEAESATIVGGIVHANTASAAHAGFTGDSFVDYLHPTGDYVEWSVPSCRSGSATASFRYALGGGNRPMQVLVNGQEVESELSFPATGSWASWSEASVTVELNEGSNVIRLSATGRSGANMDSLILSEGPVPEDAFNDGGYTPVCSMVDDPRLLAYHDAGSCGPMGNDHNVAWCGGASVRECPDTVETDICPSGTAVLATNQVGGHFAVGDCRYWLYAQYRCQDDPRLLAYHDAGSCGPMGNDHNVAWCGGANVRECPDIVDTVDTDICPSGSAVLASNQVGGNFAVGDCRYWLYAQYQCLDDPRLLAYHDAGSCGPMGNDHNVAWCGGANVRECPATVETDICPSGSAFLASNQVGGHFAVGDCRYWLYAQYRC